MWQLLSTAQWTLLLLTMTVLMIKPTRLNLITPNNNNTTDKFNGTTLINGNDDDDNKNNNRTMMNEDGNKLRRTNFNYNEDLRQHDKTNFTGNRHIRLPYHRYTTLETTTATSTTAISNDTTDGRDMTLIRERDEEAATDDRIDRIDLGASSSLLLKPSHRIVDDHRPFDVVERKEEIDEAIEYGLRMMNDLYHIKEPKLYELGLYLSDDEPASKVASFSAPTNERATLLAKYGYATVEASAQLAKRFFNENGRQAIPNAFPQLRADSLFDRCPLRGRPTCRAASKRYRTADGTCNNVENPWFGASMLPMQRFLPPHYDDFVQSPRRSVFGGPLPSPRRVSTLIHRDVDNEVPSITMMFMQWGQFLDHDVTSVAQARAFNGSVPRCCHPSGRSVLPRELTHPECMPISVPETDNFYGRFGIGCLEFIRSAPTTRIDCELGHREQINQVTAYIDGSTIYGSDTRRAESLRTFRKGKLLYGRSRNRGPLNPPDPSGNELCRTGALSSACFTSGDGRSNEQPGLVAFHTVWLRYHNKLAETLSLVNAHWSDEKVYQESRRIVGALIQHITYSEFLPLLLGQDVMDIFGLSLLKTGYYKGYSAKVNPTPGNAFGAAAFRFGHSLVPNSYMRSDRFHRPLTNNVSLHNEPANGANIWPRGSLDRLLIGLADQGTQRRDEFVCAELTNHLFQAPHTDGFGMDLAAINVQRGRDHGLPAFTAWREPCGLRPIKDWHDLDDILRPSTVGRLRSIYSHVDDVDLYTAGLAERPVRGGIVGPTFACIIAQQFANLRRGDRFWYENGDYESSFTPAQLQRIRKIAFAHVLCQTTDEIDTIQRYAFLSADDALNARTSCADPSIDNFDVTPWIQKSTKADGEVEGRIEERVLVRFGDGADYSEESSEERSEKATKTDDNDDSDDDDDDAEDDSDYYSDEDEDDDEEDSKGRKRPQKRKKKPPPPNRRVKNKAKKPTTRRPTIYYIKRPQDLDAIKIKLQNISSATIAVSNNQKRPTVYVTDRPQTTKRPLKIVPLSEYHQNLYSNLQYLRPTELTTTATRGPYDDVTYVMGHVVQKRPTTTLADEPFKDYNLNININYLIPTTTTTTSATASTGYYGNRPISDRYVTRRPEDSYSATVHRRPPTFVTSTPLLITDAPHSTGPKPITNPNNNDFHYGDSNNFFSDKYLTLINDRFAADKYPTQQRPVVYESATNAARPPSSSPSTIKYDRRPIQIPTANGHPTDDSYTPNPIDYLTITSKRKYTTERYYDRYATTTKPRPYPIRPLIDGLYGQTNSRPSSTYVHDNNHHEDDDDINNFPFPTHTDKQRPSYNSELTLIIDAKHKQSLNEIYKQVLNAAPNVLANKRPSFASFVSTTTYRPYESAFPDHGEKNFVKISAVRGGVYGEASRQEGKEGDFVLDDGDDVVVEEPDLLAIDVMPSEMKPEDWLRYGTDGDAGDFGRLPAFNLDAKCSDELPRPIASKLR